MFPERKRLQQYRKVAVLVNDRELCCIRVGAFFSSVSDAAENAARHPRFSDAGVYVRHDPPPEPVLGDYQI